MEVVVVHQDQILPEIVYMRVEYDPGNGNAFASLLRILSAFNIVYVCKNVGHNSKFFPPTMETYLANCMELEILIGKVPKKGRL